MTAPAWKDVGWKQHRLNIGVFTLLVESTDAGMWCASLNGVRLAARYSSLDLAKSASVKAFGRLLSEAVQIAEGM